MAQDDEFLALMMGHQKELASFIASMVWDRHACNDLMQELALVLWRRFAEYDRGRPFGAWARGCALNLVRTYYAARKRETTAFSPAAQAAIARAYEETPQIDSDQEEALRGCLQTLPENSRNVLNLRYEQDLSLQQMGERLSRSASAVNMLLSRLRSKLQECLQKRLGLMEHSS